MGDFDLDMLREAWQKRAEQEQYKKETVIILDEFRAFRHVFRNVYGFAFDPDRLQRLLLKFPQAVESLTKDMLAFLDVVKRITPNQTNDRNEHSS